MTKSLLLAFGVLLMGCKTELSLGSLTSKKSSSDSSSSHKKSQDDESGDSDSDDSEESASSSKSKGGGSVTPPPEVGKLESGKAPPWCKGYEKSSSDSNSHWVKSQLEREGYSGKTLEYMAKAACDKTDSARQSEVAEWASAFKAAFAATDKDFVEVMTYSIMKSEDKHKLEDEQCGPYKEKDAEATGEKKWQQATEAWLLGCGRDLDEDVLYYFDKPQVTEVQRLAILSRCTSGDRANEKDMKGEFGMCLPDMKQLDRAKFDKELAGMQVNLAGKVNALLTFGEQKAASQILLKRYADKGKKDEEWQALFDAPEKGWKDWFAIYESNKESFDAVRDFDKKATKGSKKALADCGNGLRKLWFQHVKQAKKVKNLEAAQAVGTDAVGFPLIVAMMRCDAATEQYLAVAAAQDLFMQRAKDARGPRYAAYEATIAALNEIRNDREKFPLERLYPAPPRTGRDVWYKAYEQTFNKISYDRGTGQIKSLKKKGDNVHVEFKTVKWKEEVAYDCRDTRKLSRIDENGNLIYEQKCKYKTETMSSTLEPVDIPADFAEGLKTGLMIDLMIDTKKGRVGIPKGVYKDVDKKKFVGTFGVVW